VFIADQQYKNMMEKKPKTSDISSGKINRFKQAIAKHI